MNRPKLMKPVFICLVVAFAGLLITAILNDFIPFEVYGVVHPLFGFTFAACVLAHLFVNWNWIKANLRPAAK